MSQAEAVPEVGKSGLFARTATGLVRGVPPRSSLIINFIPGHPTQTMAAVLLFALAVVTAGLSPLCVSIGLIGDYPGLVSWGNHISTSKGWLLFFGLIMFAFAGVIQLWGWRWILRLQNIFFWMVTASLLLCGAAALILSKSHFVSKFNGFAKGITGRPDAYA